MKYLILDDLNTFQCIGDKCSYTCCKDWKINIDAASTNFYRNVKGEFGEKLKNDVIDWNGNSYFQLEEDGRCPFLNKDFFAIFISIWVKNIYAPPAKYILGKIGVMGISHLLEKTFPAPRLHVSYLKLHLR